GELRAARLRERVPEGALSRGVLYGAAQQPADGVLPSVDAREGCAAPRRPLRADRRAGLGLAVPRRARRTRAARADVRERTAEGGGPGHCRLPIADCRIHIAEWRLPIGARSRALSQMRMRRSLNARNAAHP